MSSICGIFYRKNKKVEGTEISAMIEKLNYINYEKVDSFCDNNLALGACVRINSIYSENEKQPLIRDELVVVSDARIDNREELSRNLDCDINISDSELIYLAYKRWKEDSPKYLVGDYAYAIYDKNTNKIFCARDHAGFRPFFYYVDEEKFVFASEIKAILAIPDIELDIDEEWIADAISTVAPEFHRTIFKEVFRLDPANSLSIDNFNFEKKKYWNLDFNKKTFFEKEEDYINEFRKALIEAVNCRIKTKYPVASELSGGIDSSGVTSIAFDILEKDNSRFYALSHVLPDNLLGKVHPYFDERDFSNLVCEYAGIKNHVYVTSSEKTIIREMEEAINIQDGVMPQNLYLFSDELYEKAKEKNCRTLLSGFGGDEFVSNSGGGYLEELIHKLKYYKAFKKIRVGRGGVFSRLVKFSALLANEYTPFIYKLFRQRNAWVKERYKELLFDKDFGVRVSIKKRYARMKGFPVDKSMEMRQFKRFHLPHVALRHETCCLAARRKGLDYAYPLWDRRLMELFFSFPSEIKFGNGKGRYIYRKAIAEFVPSKIHNRADKTGTTISTVDLRILNDKENIRKLLEESAKNNKTVYVDYSRAMKVFEKVIEKATNPDAEKVNKGVFLKALKVLVYQNVQSNSQQ